MIFWGTIVQIPVLHYELAYLSKDEVFRQADFSVDIYKTTYFMMSRENVFF